MLPLAVWKLGVWPQQIQELGFSSIICIFNGIPDYYHIWSITAFHMQKWHWKWSLWENPLKLRWPKPANLAPRNKESEISFVHTSKGTQYQYLLSEVLTIRVGLCIWGIHRDGMRSTYYPGVCIKPGTYYQGWFMFTRYTQGQNEEYLLSRSMY